MGDDRPTIEFCGLETVVEHHPFTIGRHADLVIEDDNLFLHRRFLQLSMRQGVWLLANEGARLTATVSDGEGRLEAFLGPGAVLPLVCDVTVVRFSAGPTTYEFTIHLAAPPLVARPVDQFDDGDATIGHGAMTFDQMRLVLALAEPALRGGGRVGAAMPSSADAARRLGWTTTRFNRKLDNVCQKLSTQGVRGLHGDPGHLASNRRARLVEYALAVRLVTRQDLDLLDALAPAS
jgi:hypothetical protein